VCHAQLNRIREIPFARHLHFFPIAVFCDPDILDCNDCVPMATLSVPKTLLDSATQCRISSGRLHLKLMPSTYSSISIPALFAKVPSPIAVLEFSLKLPLPTVTLLIIVST
jgi:hypothetical protein